MEDRENSIGEDLAFSEHEINEEQFFAIIAKLKRGQEVDDADFRNEVAKNGVRDPREDHN